MRPEALMKLGGATALVGFVGVIFPPEGMGVMPAILMAMGACLFGKGYGVWEERNR
jgi:hypothetical protein